MKSKFEILVFEGDGIGPEIMAPTIDVLNHLQQNKSDYHLNFKNASAGALHYSKTGESLPKSSLEAARDADAILLSAMGLPDVRYPDGTEISPQIELRKELNLFAGVRPVIVFPDQASPIKRSDDEMIDFVLIRESTEGLFYSQGCGEVSENEARETLVITRETSNKLFKFAFQLAQRRKDAGRGPGKVTCVDKANVFRAFAFFRQLFDEEAINHSDLLSDHAYVDACALWMVQRPWTFDVLVTENMFGDILSDLGAGLMGGLGIAPSADIGEGHAIFQPCHGSAPDIAGQGIANPFAMILSAAMMLDWLGHENSNSQLLSDAQYLQDAVYSIIRDGNHLTRDLGGSCDTKTVVDVVLKALNR